MSIFKHHNHATLGQHASKPMTDNETHWAFLKIFFAWLAAAIAELFDTVTRLSLAEWVQFAALVFTLAQTFFLFRDKWWRERKQRRTARRIAKRPQ